MTIYATKEGNLHVRQGDTGNIVITGIPTDRIYSVYFSVYNPENNRILVETSVSSEQATGKATFAINETFSNALRVGEWEYGIKICSQGTEDTLVPRMYVNDEGELVQENAPLFIVYDKFVEGD